MEVFRETRESMRCEGRDPCKGGRPPHDAVRMFKVLVLREMYALSDEQAEYQIADRFSLRVFSASILPKRRRTTRRSGAFASVWARSA